ncbi:hypothetical protein CH365_17935 [Leptospira neocaledonica]|uniref:Uncharacterized protein n=1 Tax=Leptospira neocaledonica TaxID=2023192 RepID=A0A2M9ZUE9_9LEPT|nr:hypothetical protein CH365_17935 [Leptospira neocaledonica]
MGGGVVGEGDFRLYHEILIFTSLFAAGVLLEFLQREGYIFIDKFEFLFPPGMRRACPTEGGTRRARFCAN